MCSRCHTLYANVAIYFRRWLGIKLVLEWSLKTVTKRARSITQRVDNTNTQKTTGFHFSACAEVHNTSM